MESEKVKRVEGNFYLENSQCTTDKTYSLDKIYKPESST